MGNKTNPTSNRLGILYTADSTWYAGKRDFAKKLQEDEVIRAFIRAQVPRDIIAEINIERSLKIINVHIHTHRPGIIIGPGGSNIQTLTQKLKKKINKTLQINIVEVKKPELHSMLVAQSVRKQIEMRMPYARAVRMAIANGMKVGAQGIEVIVSGRLNGAEIARREKKHEGRVPKHTLRADLSYAFVKAKTIYGVIGIKVMIFLKEVYGKRTLGLRSTPAPTTRKGAPPVRFLKNKS